MMTINEFLRLFRKHVRAKRAQRSPFDSIRIIRGEGFCPHCPITFVAQCEGKAPRVPSDYPQAADEIGLSQEDASCIVSCADQKSRKDAKYEYGEDDSFDPKIRRQLRDAFRYGR